ncbi:hypothetical protein NEPTK9_000160 [Candidatus Neptunochlamydia vexilliferae]|uniref:Uncharacterized protein n=1 Tax=Candidatus Neptunichlamydia vexilliferae TaxID=1651774 RepID=A0ABS0AX13_9BACT|nr:hypothetical protein [Candidatus Neptunochlamydia vexilliferae]
MPFQSFPRSIRAREAPLQLSLRSLVCFLEEKLGVASRAEEVKVVVKGEEIGKGFLGLFGRSRLLSS